MYREQGMALLLFSTGEGNFLLTESWRGCWNPLVGHLSIWIDVYWVKPVFLWSICITQIREVLLVEIIWNKTRFHQLQNSLSFGHSKFLLMLPSRCRGGTHAHVSHMGNIPCLDKNQQSKHTNSSLLSLVVGLLYNSASSLGRFQGAAAYQEAPRRRV